MIKKQARKELRKADKEWSINVRNRDKCCVICGRTEYLNAHHLIPRQIKLFRHTLDNGVTLCPRCHKYSSECSAHKNPFMFYRILKIKRPEQYENINKLYPIIELSNMEETK